VKEVGQRRTAAYRSDKNRRHRHGRGRAGDTCRAGGVSRSPSENLPQVGAIN
jgi:hypothetical protein